MAESFVQLNNDGPGKKIDTFTESTTGQHRQAMVVADPSVTGGTATVDSVNGLSVNPKTLPPNAAQEANGHLASIDAKEPALGQAVMAASTPVVIASNQTPVEVELFDSAENGLTSTGNALDVNIKSTGITQPISATSLPLPTGASTAAKQPALGTAGTPSADVISVQGITSMTPLKVDGSGVTQPVSGTVTTTPPVNASTNITQVGGSALSEGQKAMAASVPVVVASDQSAIPVSGTVTTTPPSNASTNIAQVGGSALSEGQKAMAASVPVAIASDQSAVTVSGTVTTTPPANASTNVAQFGGSAVVTGTGAGGTGIPRVTISNDSSLAANQSVNVNQVGGVAITEGQKTSAASIPVVVASDQSNLPDNLTQIAGTAVSTAAAGVQKIGISGATAVTLDAAQNAAAPANELVVGGVYQTTVPALTAGNASQLQTDSTGALAVNREGRKATYSATAVFSPTVTAATDVFTITGSATKTVRVTKLTVFGTETTAATQIVEILKRSTANSGGTSAASTAVPHDSNSSAATATVLSYTANPTTLGTLLATIRTGRPFFGSGATPQDPSSTYVFGDVNEQAIVLRGTGQVLAVSLNSASIVGVSLRCWVEWTEE
jgi:hypothetical protein